MKIRFLSRDIEISNRVNINNFKKENLLIEVSYRKSDLKNFKTFKQMILCCFMPYKWLERKFL